MSTGTSTSRRTAVGEVEDWRHSAACVGQDPELFQPPTDEGALFEAQVAAAKAVCTRCPVRAECLVFALAMLPFGIAGGLTEQERNQVRARSRDTWRERRVARRSPARSPAELAAAGRAALRGGAEVQEVARRFRVSKRTATRWAAQARGSAAGTVPPAGEGSHGGNRAPLQNSHTNALARTRAAEGRRS